jgi:hypothetical protein
VKVYPSQLAKCAAACMLFSNVDSGQELLAAWLSELVIKLEIEICNN